MTERHIYPEFMQTGSTTTWAAPNGSAAPKKAQAATMYGAQREKNGTYQLFSKIVQAKNDAHDANAIAVLEIIQTHIDFHTALQRLEILEDMLRMSCRFNRASQTFTDDAVRAAGTHYSLVHPHVDLAAIALPDKSSVPVGTIPITVMLTRDGIGPEETVLKKKRPPAPRFRP